MTIKQAIKILIRANKCSRGSDVEMPDQKEFGDAIDVAIAVMGAMLIKEPRLKKHQIKPKRYE